MDKFLQYTEKPRRQVLLGLGLGKSTAFPLAQLSSVRADCSRYGLQWGRKFSSSVDRESGSVIVTRMA